MAATGNPALNGDRLGSNRREVTARALKLQEGDREAHNHGVVPDLLALLRGRMDEAGEERVLHLRG